jgi:hypothetical protein
MKKMVTFNIKNYNHKFKNPTIIHVTVDDETLKKYPSKMTIDNQEYTIDYSKMQIVIYSN